MMIESYEREMSSEERRSLEALLVDRVASLAERVILKTLYVAICAVLVAAVCAIIYGMARILIDEPFNLLLVVFVLLAGSVLLFLPIRLLWSVVPAPIVQRRFEAVAKTQTLHLLENGRVKVDRVTATRAITVSAFDDEGEAVILAISENESVTLFGQCIGPVDVAADWPAVEFEWVRSALDNSELGIFATKGRLKPELELEWDCFEDGSDVDWPWGIAVVEKTPEQILAEWKYTGPPKTRD